MVVHAHGTFGRRLWGEVEGQFRGAISSAGCNGGLVVATILLCTKLATFARAFLAKPLEGTDPEVSRVVARECAKRHQHCADSS